MFCIVIDVHRNILSAQCSIKCHLQNTEINNIKVKCTKTHLLVNFYNGCQLLQDVKILTPDNFFIPSSVLVQDSLCKEIELKNDILTISRYCHDSNLTTTNGLQIPENDPSQKSEENICNIDCEKHFDVMNDSSSNANNKIEINFRIQISSSEIIPACESVKESLSDSHSLQDFFKSEIKCHEPYQVVCTNCDIQLSTCPVTFHQVKEYCDSFSDLSESWFCHKKVIPKCGLDKNTLYVSETCIFLHSSISDSFSFDACGKEIRCKTCGTVLSCGSASHSDGEHLKQFYLDAVTLKTLDSKPCCSKMYCHKIVLLSLWTIISQKSHTCRILFQSKVDSTDQCILMWIPPMKIAKFKLQSTLLSLPTQVDFSVEDVYQVQYHIGLLCSPLVKKWSKDFNVDFYEVGSSFLNTLKKILISSTECKTSTDFSSGYLPCNASYPC